jgi:hypothetical protein
MAEQPRQCGGLRILNPQKPNSAICVGELLNETHEDGKLTSMAAGLLLLVELIVGGVEFWISSRCNIRELRRQ